MKRFETPCNCPVYYCANRAGFLSVKPKWVDEADKTIFLHEFIHVSKIAIIEQYSEEGDMQCVLENGIIREVGNIDNIDILMEAIAYAKGK